MKVEYKLLEKLMIARHSYKNRALDALNGINVSSGCEHDKQISYVIVN